MVAFCSTEKCWEKTEPPLPYVLFVGKITASNKNTVKLVRKFWVSSLQIKLLSCIYSCSRSLNKCESRLWKCTSVVYYLIGLFCIVLLWHLFCDKFTENMSKLMQLKTFAKPLVDKWLANSCTIARKIKKIYLAKWKKSFIAYATASSFLGKYHLCTSPHCTQAAFEALSFSPFFYCLESNGAKEKVVVVVVGHLNLYKSFLKKSCPF